ncbi:NADH-quinone oxidoreductase subunit N [bacterium]|nr:NADH-quinone oxidoreductase subunit N [bacterium]
MDPKLFYAQVVQSLLLTSPLLVLLGAAIIVLAADVLMPRGWRGALPWISGLGVAAALFVLNGMGMPAAPQHAFSGALVLDRLTFLADNVILGMALYLIAISPRWLRGRLVPHGEYYALLLFAAMAMMALGRSSELLALFLNFELLSITFYVLLGIEKRNARSTEAGFKYFIVGSTAAAFLLMGIVFVYGATHGQTRYEAILKALFDAKGAVQPDMFALGMGLLIVGFGFKITLAPFHMYAPDVYEGGPTPVVAALATGTKVAGFTALYHLVAMAAGFKAIPAGVWAAFYAVVMTSMIVGNVGAVVQPNVKRLLAYSSIAHSGYMMIPLVVVLAKPGLLGAAEDAIAYYMLAYTLMTLLAFGVISALAPEGEGPIASWAGLGRRAPLRAACMALAMISLIGIPPTVGFFGKLYLFGMAIEGGHIWLAVVGILASVVSVTYYLRVVITMYMAEPAEGAEKPGVMGDAQILAVGLAAACVFVFAIFPWLYHG